MVDLTKTIAPKTDQLNADDLLGGKTKTIKITGVREYSSSDQPIGINYEGDNGKPWKPCLGMRRVLIELWGQDAAREADKSYRGRMVTLYRDPDVKFGNAVMGGIRISHASDIKSDKKIALTVSRARRIEFVVKPLQIDKTESQSQPAASTQSTTSSTEKPQSTPEQQAASRKVLAAIKMEGDANKINEIFEVDYKAEMDFLKEEKSPLFQWLVDEGEKKKNILLTESGILPSLMGG